VNAAFKAASEAGPLKGILAYSELELVSVRLHRQPALVHLDAKSTNVIDGTLVKLSGWYDNEWGYSNRCLDLLRLVGGTR
jgi:glyceraldehyde 3-phosphate dehydrogenase